jgi:phage major head subunit gpT-like protein
MLGIANRLAFPDLYLTTWLPGLRAVTMNRFGRKPEQYSKVFRVLNTTRSLEQTSEVTGLSTFIQVGEGENTRYDAPLPAYNKNYIPTDWTLGYKITHRAQADDQYGVVAGMARMLGDSANETVEVQAAIVYNYGFVTTGPDGGSTAGPDGVALFATNHPLIGGGVQANRPSPDADLDIPSLEAGLTAVRNFVNHRGLKVRAIPRRLVVPPALRFAAAEILLSEKRSDVANNAINAFKNIPDEPTLTPFTYDYLTDDDAWFVLPDTEDLELRFYWRERFDQMQDVDFDSRSIKVAGWMTFDRGFSDYLPTYGTTGAP